VVTPTASSSTNASSRSRGTVASRLIADELRRGSLHLVLEQYAAAVPWFFLYFPSRAQVSPALRAFVDVAREMASESMQRAR
jgi:DNA-binding transcriptional LysR family regulator